MLLSRRGAACGATFLRRGLLAAWLTFCLSSPAVHAQLDTDAAPVGLSAPADSPAAGPTPQLEAAVEPERVLTLDLTRDANDIWDRIRRGFGMPDLDSARVMDQQAF